MFYRVFAAVFLFLITAPTVKAEVTVKPKKPKISIVVDDLGDNSIVAKQLVKLPIPLTMAILPQTPFAKKIARLAEENGHEVIMHLPMEAFSRPDLLGPGAILSNMSQQEVHDTILQNANSIPYIVGLNNHMGSLLTENKEKMQWVMSLVKSQNWYFLDSKTSEQSIAEDIARNHGIPSIGRDIFLDHHTPETKHQLKEILEKQFKRAIKIANRRGEVVIVCHPYDETLVFLNTKIAKNHSDYEFVLLSQLTNHNNSHVAKHDTVVKHEAVAKPLLKTLNH